MLDLPSTPEWMERGSCAASAYPDLWYSEGHDETTLAKRICYRCQVVSDCALYAMKTQEKFGIWGGLTPTERKGRR